MTTSRKLALGGAVVAGVTAYMAYLGASASWQYYLTADECVAQAPTLIGNRLRVSGKVAPQTLHVAEDRKQVAFSLEGTKKNLHVICSGQPPDNLAEQMDVVVDGRLDASGLLHADKILTRCASKYKSQQKLSAMPPTASQPLPRGEP